MSFGNQPEGGRSPWQRPTQQMQAPMQPNQNQAGYGTAGRYGASGSPVDARTAYAYERAQRVSTTKAYGEMTLGLVVTAVVAVLTQATGLLYSYLNATGALGWIMLAVVQVGLAIVLASRVMSMRPATARVMFYIYAALMGFTLSSIFAVYSLGSIGIVLGLCAGFFFILTMLGLTTKVNLLKAGPILLAGLLMLIIAQVVLMFVAPNDTTMRIVATLGLILFAAMTAHDAQATRAIFTQYATQGPEMVERVSILCALNLYLDFVNMFLYLLQLFGGGSRN